MKKPKMKIEKIVYQPLSGEPYEVHVLDGAHSAPFVQGYLRCTGCGKGHQYRWNQDSPWVQFQCPLCNTVSAWWEEYYDDEEDES